MVVGTIAVMAIISAVGTTMVITGRYVTIDRFTIIRHRITSQSITIRLPWSCLDLDSVDRGSEFHRRKPGPRLD